MNELQNQLESIRSARKKSRRLPYRRSRLDAHRAEIERLRELEGASLEDIRLWLRRFKRIHVARSTILRRLAKWSAKGK